jgi:histidine triad (HIT) family protein
MTYDPNNVFAKILRGDIACSKVLETSHALAFHDIAPAAPVHALVICKGAYMNMVDFLSRARATEISDYYAALHQTIATLGVENDCRIISNTGANSGQTVFHFHSHILGGKILIAD